MNRLRAVLDWRHSTSARTRPAAEGPAERPIPPVIAERLIDGNPEEPLYRKLQQYGRGRPGVTRERELWWVIRDDRGRVVGGAVVGPVRHNHPVSVDVGIDPRRQRQGFATALYAALEDAGLDMEAASAASLAHRFMTPLGYLFMRSRRLRDDPEAEEKIIASANVCPGCGPLR